MREALLRLYVVQQSARVATAARLARTEGGEGVISAAIAVLVMAFLGVVLWQLFGDTLRRANSDVNERLGELR
ncbi:MAG TPA: hypothetical protein VHF47_00320 [Acidimicrobiales bacterium]|nr:hypothetical protein [Acidimicrobiales bacterium]